MRILVGPQEEGPKALPPVQMPPRLAATERLNDMHNLMRCSSFEPGHVFICDRSGCGRKASRLLTSYTDEENDLRTIFLCPKHESEFMKLRSKMSSSDGRELMAGNILSMLHAVNKLIENGDKLKRALDSARAERDRLKASGGLKRPSSFNPKKPEAAAEDEILGGR